MTTFLLFMLGLLSAGAGAYTLFRDKSDSKDSGTGSGKSGGGSGSAPDSSVRNDRGKEIPVSQGGVSPLATKGGAPPSSVGSSPILSKAGAGQEVGAEDPKKHKDPFPGLRKKTKLDLKNKVDDIIRNNSKFANHRRPLINAEALVDKESYNGALEIYKRTKTRVPDQEIQGKIQENIDQIEDHLESDEEDVYSPENYEGPPIPLGDLVRAIKDISESLGDTISKGFGNPVSLPLSPMDPGAIPGPLIPPGGFTPGPVSYHIVSPGPSLPPGNIPAPSSDSFGSTPTSFLPSGGVVGTPSGGSSGGAAGGAAPGGASGAREGAPGGSSGSGGEGTFGEGSTGSVDGGGNGGAQTHSGGPSGNAFTGGAGSTSDRGYDSPSQQPSSARGPLDPNAMDLPEDTFFSEDWEKFKDLPLVDRRTGESRRSGGERRGQDPNRKDRRGEIDRRQEDLFKLRDDYLKQKEEQKKQERENLSESQRSMEPGDSDWSEASSYQDDLPPFLTPVVPKIELVPIRLPEPQDKTVRAESETPSTSTSPTAPRESPTESSATSPSSEQDLKPLELPKIGLPDPVYQKTEESTPEIPHLAPAPGADEDAPEIELLEGGLEPFDEEDKERGEGEESGGAKDEEPRMIHGILELKPPEVDDAPFLTLTYDFDKIPHAFKLSKNYSIMEYSYYKYKPMLVKAQEFARRKMLKNALNYYRVIKSQNIPPELRKMINRNIKDISEFMEKYLMAKGG
ncbi:hypothetical protein AB3N59_05475 [Leptospira sp. WS92.C1]